MTPKAAKVGLRALREELPAVLKDVQKGQEVTITNHGKPVATISPATPPLQQEPEVIAFGSLKGGVGKTTIAMHLATYLSQLGRKVVLLDADNEMSAARWSAKCRDELPFQVKEADIGSLIKQAQQLRAEHVTVIIDTPPNSREILTRASLGADLTIIPVLPTGVDIDRLRATLDLMEDLNAGRNPIEYRLMLNRVNPRKQVTRAAMSVLRKHPHLNTQFRDLTEYERVFGHTPGLMEEPAQLWAELMGETQHAEDAR